MLLISLSVDQEVLDVFAPENLRCKRCNNTNNVGNTIFRNRNTDEHSAAHNLLDKVHEGQDGGIGIVGALVGTTSNSDSLTMSFLLLFIVAIFS